MINVLELVTDVVSSYSRFDMEDRMIRNFGNFLSSAHSLDFFRRDIKRLYIVNPSIINSNVSIDLNEAGVRYRKIQGIQLYSDYVQVGTLVTPGTSIYTSTPYKEVDADYIANYYGFKEFFTWQSASDRLVVRDVAQNATCIEVVYFGYPSYGQNQITGAWETDSWIMKEKPELIEAYARKWLCSHLKDAELQQGANSNFALQRQEFLAAYTQEIVTW